MSFYTVSLSYESHFQKRLEFLKKKNIFGFKTFLGTITKIQGFFSYTFYTHIHLHITKPVFTSKHFASKFWYVALYGQYFYIHQFFITIQTFCVSSIFVLKDVCVPFLSVCACFWRLFCSFLFYFVDCFFFFLFCRLFFYCPFCDAF